MSKLPSSVHHLGLFANTEDEAKYNIDYDKHGDRLKLFLPQDIVKRKRDMGDGTVTHIDPAGVNAFGVYVEITRSNLEGEKPFFHLALVPRANVLKPLLGRLAAHKIEASEWPITYSPEAWHGGSVRKSWKRYTQKPLMAITQSGDPVFDKLAEAGFITPDTVTAIGYALEAFGESNPGKFAPKALKEKLKKLYPSQIEL